MKLRRLNILIIILYSVAALCLLGVGSTREKLKKINVVEQTDLSDDGVALPGQPEVVAQGISERREELQRKLTIWQIVTLVIFATASLVLMFREKLIKAIPPKK